MEWSFQNKVACLRVGVSSKPTKNYVPDIKSIFGYIRDIVFFPPVLGYDNVHRIAIKMKESTMYYLNF